ncbi:hypothetical protein BJ912DRAFT_424743 [Pholiota molesta]|nr:hypothetical protein BJ912DRAFT_424743 [Pholiota molesta]
MSPLTWEPAAQAFMTTGTFPKLRSLTFTIEARSTGWRGWARARMIHPIMGPASTSFTSMKKLHATLLECVMTDASVSPRGVCRARSGMLSTGASILTVWSATCQPTTPSMYSRTVWLA